MVVCVVSVGPVSGVVIQAVQLREEFLSPSGQPGCACRVRATSQEGGGAPPLSDWTAQVGVSTT